MKFCFVVVVVGGGGVHVVVVSPRNQPIKFG